jgi:hypothetical protein
MDTSIHVAFLTGEQAFRWQLRHDGQPFWKKPLTPKNGTNTLSPFVALATRPKLRRLKAAAVSRGSQNLHAFLKETRKLK